MAGAGAEALEKAVSRAVGEELRRAREAKRWSRGYLVARLPSGIGARTLLSYEHGTRHLTMLRFVEVCQALGVSAPHVLGLGLQRARTCLDNLALWVDLWALVDDDTAEFRLIILWAHNKLVQYPSGIVQVEPTAIQELATLINTSRRELAAYLTQFTPDLKQIREEETSPVTDAPP